MLVFAVSDKGGTGRSVTSCNIAYHLSAKKNVAYLDFDFGSPTAGMIFEIARVERGVDGHGLHSYVTSRVTEPHQVDVWRNSSRADLRLANTNSGRLVLFPGDKGGGEFSSSAKVVTRCVELFSKLDQEFDVCIIDLSAGRSYAMEMVLRATKDPVLQSRIARWLVFHRWTRQHIVAAHSLVFEASGLLEFGEAAGHDKNTLLDSIRFVRTAVPDLNSPLITDSPAQATWLLACDDELKKLALSKRLGRSRTLGNTPLEPVLQWREQIITDADVSAKIANVGTVEKFRELARKLLDEVVWEGL